MDKNVKAYSLESEAFYKSIVRINFTPIAEVTWVKTKHKKGDIQYKCNLFTGFKKKVKKVYTDDIIDVYNNSGGYCYETTLNEYADRRGYLIRDNKLFVPAKVDVETNIKDVSRHKYFESNEDAINYINLVKQNCKTVGNTLI